MVETYDICKNSLHSDEVGDYTAYDIVIKRDDTPILNVSDVFVNREKAENFVFLCNKLGLASVHIYDVLDDIL